MSFNFGVISTHYNCTCILDLIRYDGHRVFPGGKVAGAWRLPPARLAPRLKKE